MSQWNELRKQCEQKGGQWPFDRTRDALAAEWLAKATQPGPLGWQPIGHINERGVTPAEFIKGIVQKPAVP